MITVYPLEWIDSLIMQTLDPKKKNISDLSDNDLTLIAQNLSRESQKIQVQLKNEIFSLQKKRQVRLLIRKYHSTLVYLLDNAIENQKNIEIDNKIALCAIDFIIKTLNDLISFVENRYSIYLSLDERVPFPYLMVFKKEVSLRLDKIKKKNNKVDSYVIEILCDALSSSRNRPENKITYREILYQKELLKRVEEQIKSADHFSFYSSIDVLLIELNFNYHKYISYFTEQIENRINLQGCLINKINELLLCSKEFSKLLSSERITFDPAKQNIRYILDNWFKQEIAYMEKKIALGNGAEIETNLPDENQKVQCMLSTDQMGLILRAGDEARILKAKSMSQVFRSIIPFLSTPFKNNLSYESVRSKSYNAEDRDKEAAIAILEKIINKIKSY